VLLNHLFLILKISGHLIVSSTIIRFSTFLSFLWGGIVYVDLGYSMINRGVPHLPIFLASVGLFLGLWAAEAWQRTLGDPFRQTSDKSVKA